MKFKWKLILVIDVPLSKNLHSNKSWKYFKRIMSTSKELTIDEVLNEKHLRWLLRYEYNTIDGVKIKNILSSKYFEDYFNKEKIIWLTTSLAEEYLNIHDLVNENWFARISTILWFLDNPDYHLKSSIVINKFWFKKTSRKMDYDRTRIEEPTKRVSWPIEMIIRDSIKYLVDFFYKKWINFPEVALKEAIVNAVVHREYAISDDIKIDIFDNQIEITNPWTFLWWIGKDFPNKYQRNIRNQQLYWILSRISFFEQDRDKKLNLDMWEGIKTIYSSIRKTYFEDPEFINHEETTTIVFKFSQISTYQDKILKYLQEKWTISNSEARKITWEEDKEKIKNIFKKLERNFMIERVDKNVAKNKVRYKLLNAQIEDSQQALFGYNQ